MLTRFVVCLVVLLSGTLSGFAQQAQEPSRSSLKVGDEAPAMTIDKWVKGRPANKLEKNKVYAVVFWATWCPPCIRSIPDLTELQRKHQRNGLVVIGVAASERGSEPRDRLKGVEDFVRKQGRKMEYTVGFDATGSMWREWMSPAGRRGIPSGFVVDKGGKVSYIGSVGTGLNEAVEKALRAPDVAAAAPQESVRVASSTESVPAAKAGVTVEVGADAEALAAPALVTSDGLN